MAKKVDTLEVKENPLILYYGDGGIGKTTAAGACLPSADFIAATGGLTVTETVLGFKLKPEQKHEDVRTLDDVIALVKKSTNKYVVIDDMTILADQTVIQAKADNLKDKYAAWDFVYDRFMFLREELLYKGKLLLANAHLKEPGMSDGRKAKGTVDFPGSGRKKFPTAFECVWHCEQKQRLWGWPTVIRKRLTDSEYTVSKDKLNVVVDGCPLNIAEILRVYGIECPRIPELDTPAVNGLVENVSGLLIDVLKAKQNAEVDDLLSSLREELVGLDIKNVLHQDWVCRDTFDRAEIAVLRAQAEGSLFRRKK